MRKIVEGVVYRSRTRSGADTYGVTFRDENGGVITFEDVNPDRKVSAAIAERLTGEAADEQQLRYLVEDRLGEVYDGSRS